MVVPTIWGLAIVTTAVVRIHHVMPAIPPVATAPALPLSRAETAAIPARTVSAALVPAMSLAISDILDLLDHGSGFAPRAQPIRNSGGTWNRLRGREQRCGNCQRNCGECQFQLAHDVLRTVDNNRTNSHHIYSYSYFLLSLICLNERRAVEGCGEAGGEEIGSFASSQIGAASAPIVAVPFGTPLCVPSDLRLKGFVGCARHVG